MNDKTELYIGVDNDAFNAIKHDLQHELTMELNEDNKEELIHAQGNAIALITDELPTTSYGAYLYNHGVFPYILHDIKTLHVLNGSKELRLDVRAITTSPGTRFNWDHDNRKAVENPDGEGCMWKINYRFELQAPARTFIMRWNPGISSSKIDDFRQARQKWPDGFDYNWSIYDWKHAHKGDSYIMVRVGSGPGGVVYHGTFLSEPYAGDDWAGSGHKRYYVDISVEHPCDPDEPCVTIDQLEDALPEIEWQHGHSGVAMTQEQAQKFWHTFQPVGNNTTAKNNQ